LAILICQIVVALVSYYTIYRHRVIYALKTAVLRMPREGLERCPVLDTRHIDQELRTGKYTIIQIVKREDGDLEVILGQIKK